MSSHSETVIRTLERYRTGDHFDLSLSSISFSLSSCPLCSLHTLSPMSLLSPSFSPHLPLFQSLLMATCLSIIDILTGLTTRPPVAPLSFSLPYLNRALTRHPHTHTHTHTHTCRCTSLCKCVRQKLWKLCVCVCSSQWDRKRETKWESTQSMRRVSIFRPTEENVPSV